MAFLGQDDPMIDDAQRYVRAAQETVQLRDELWQGKTQVLVKMVIGTTVGLWIIYRLLIK